MKNFEQSIDGQFKCKLCSSKIKHKRNARTHFVQSHQEAYLEFECPICQRILNTRNRLRTHIVAKQWVVSWVGHWFVHATKTRFYLKPKPWSLVIHFLGWTLIRACDSCPFYNFRNPKTRFYLKPKPWSLVIHFLGDNLVLVHFTTLDPYGFCCNICQAVITSSRQAAEKHYVEKHQEAGLEFCCPHCNSVSTTRSAICKHLLRHHDVKMSRNSKDLYRFMRRRK